MEKEEIIIQDSLIDRTNATLQSITSTYFNWRILISFVACVAISIILGKFIASFLRRVVQYIGARADKSQNLAVVNRLRRFETYIILSSAVIRVALVFFGIYFWWLFDHSDTQPTALIGASALLILIISASVGPVIRDIVSGAAMMAEQWYAIGDFIKIEPFAHMEGVVERVTLRSTRIRTLTGEVVWVNNQHIQGIHVTPKGTRRIALELFVTDSDRGKLLIEQANDRLPIGSLLVISPLSITEETKIGPKLWHITAISETAPGREWLIENTAVELIKELDDTSEKPVISHGPLARYADLEADKKFKRTISNARKRTTPKRHFIKPKSSK